MAGAAAFFENYTQHRGQNTIRRVLSNVRLKDQICDQATKCKRWMPWCQEAMKDVASCDKPRGAANRR